MKTNKREGKSSFTKNLEKISITPPVLHYCTVIIAMLFLYNQMETGILFHFKSFDDFELNKKKSFQSAYVVAGDMYCFPPLTTNVEMKRIPQVNPSVPHCTWLSVCLSIHEMPYKKRFETLALTDLRI